MKKFLKNNLSMIIIFAIIIVGISVLGIAIYITSNQEEPELLVSNNILVEYNGNDEQVKIEEEIEIIGLRAFKENVKLQKVEFASKSKVQEIGHEAFSGCIALVDIVLPKGLKTIGTRAFYNCLALESIIIPEGVTTIEDGAFENCKNLKSVVLPSTLTSLGEGVFNNCNSLEKITSKSNSYQVENNVLYTDNKETLIKYFDNSSKTYTVLSTVTKISSYAFQNSQLEEIIINENVIEIGKAIFADCDKLETIVIPFLGPNEDTASKLSYFFGENSKTIKKVTILGGSEIASIAFRNCDGLVQVVLPNTIKLIGVDAFYNLKNLVAVNIPSSVKKVENRAFGNCSKLLTITVNKSESSTSNWGDWNPSNCHVVYE